MISVCTPHISDFYHIFLSMVLQRISVYP
jgi:hypothetical protein